jgi:hypothetical protein
MFVIGIPKVVRCGNLDGLTPIIEFVPDLRYGTFETNIAAKRSFVESLDSEFVGAPDELIKRQFNAWRTNLKMCAILKYNNQKGD